MRRQKGLQMVLKQYKQTRRIRVKVARAKLVRVVLRAKRCTQTVKHYRQLRRKTAQLKACKNLFSCMTSSSIATYVLQPKGPLPQNRLNVSVLRALT